MGIAASSLVAASEIAPRRASRVLPHAAPSARPGRHQQGGQIAPASDLHGSTNDDGPARLGECPRSPPRSRPPPAPDWSGTEGPRPQHRQRVLDRLRLLNEAAQRAPVASPKPPAEQLSRPPWWSSLGAKAMECRATSSRPLSGEPRRTWPPAFPAAGRRAAERSAPPAPGRAPRRGGGSLLHGWGGLCGALPALRVGRPADSANPLTCCWLRNRVTRYRSRPGSRRRLRVKPSRRAVPPRARVGVAGRAGRAGRGRPPPGAGPRRRCCTPAAATPPGAGRSRPERRAGGPPPP